jgi:hypothetical protein
MFLGDEETLKQAENAQKSILKNTACLDSKSLNTDMAENSIDKPCDKVQKDLT